MQDDLSFGTTWKVAGSYILVMLFFMLMAYWDTVSYLLDNWNQFDIGDYAHGYLVLMISMYLIYTKRTVLKSCSPCPSYVGMAAVLMVSLLWLMSTLADVQVVQAASLLILMVALVYSVLGYQITRVLIFPLLFIGFAVPVWYPLSSVLQGVTAEVVFWWVRAFGIPAFRSEHMIVLPAGVMSVEEACSGMRYFLAGITLGALYGYLNYKSAMGRWLVVVAMACAAILANILRVFIVVYLAYETEMQHPYVKDHLNLGWYIFAAMIIILLFVESRFYKDDIADDEAVDVETSCANTSTSKASIVYALSLIFLLAGPVTVYSITRSAVDVSNEDVVTLPDRINQWVKTENKTVRWSPDFKGAGSVLQDYARVNDKVTLYIGRYKMQKQGEELINVQNTIFNRDTWSEKYTNARVVDTANGPVLEQVIEDRNKRQKIVWYWYNVSGADITNKYKAKVLQVAGLLTGNTLSYVTVVSVDRSVDNEARDALSSFVADSKNIVDSILLENYKLQ